MLTEEEKQNLLLFLNRVEVKGIKEATIYLQLVEKINSFKKEQMED